MGDPVYSGDKKVGVVTCAMVSTLTGKSMAIARLEVPVAVHGNSPADSRQKCQKDRRRRILCPSTMSTRKSARRWADMQTKLLIDGVLVAGEGEVERVLDPATGQCIAKFRKQACAK